MKRTAGVFAFAAVLLTGGIARAHHSYADFLDSTVTIQGSLDRVEFKNPHTILTIRAADGIYTAIWNAAFQLQSMGVRPTDLKVGDVVVLTGYPSRDSEAHEMAKLRKVRRPSDGWTWQMINGQATVGHLSE